MRESYDELRRLADDPNSKSAGVSFIPAVEYFDAPLSEQDLAMFSAWPGFRIFEKNELPTSPGTDSIKAGLTYSAWVINSPVYLKWLEEQAKALGAIFVRSRIGAVEEAAFVAQHNRPGLALPSIVVNASGMGIGDPACFPSRGQFMLISNEYDRTVSHHSADGNSTVIIPRPLAGGSVIGGTKEPHNWSPMNSASAVDEIIRRMTAICPDLLQPASDGPSSKPAINVTEAYIGRRPMRKGGLRLEKEQIAVPVTAQNGMSNNKSALHVVHCYGAGPSGYKIGWAAASRAAALVDECINGEM